MTYREFHERVRVLANGRYFATAVEVTEYNDGSSGAKVEWKLYVSGCNWAEGPTPEAAIAAFGQTAGEAVGSVGELPDVVQTS